MMATVLEADWCVAVFARDEAAPIAACLESLRPAADGRRFAAFVLINGCTDATQAIVEGYARRDASIHPVVIALRDKANAWNVYVHVVAPHAAVHFSSMATCEFGRPAFVASIELSLPIPTLTPPAGFR